MTERWGGVLALAVCFAGFSAQAATFHVGVRAHSGAKQAIEKWGPTMDHLTESIDGHTFVLVPHPKIPRQLEDASAGRIQFALTNPGTYVDLMTKGKAQALVTLVNDRRGTPQSRFGSVIFTRADREDIVTLGDLAGKHLRAVTPHGFGGWRAGWRELLRHGLNPHRDLKELSFGDGNQPAVVRAVIAGEVDAGIVRTDMLERLADVGEVDLRTIRVINGKSTPGFPFFHSTELYPEWPFAVLGDVDPAVVAAVKETLLAMGPEDSASEAGKYKGWTEALSYGSVRELVQVLERAESGEDSHAWRRPAVAGVLLLVLGAGAFGWRLRRGRSGAES